MTEDIMGDSESSKVKTKKPKNESDIEHQAAALAVSQIDS